MTWAAALDEQVYYGHVPALIRGGATHGNLSLVGNYNGTVLIVSVLSNGLVEHLTLGKMERAEVVLPNGSFFKVASSSPVSVMLYGGTWIGANYEGASTFHTAVDGGYVGEEFIFMALQPLSPPAEVGAGGVLVHKIYALEDSEVTIWDSYGTKVKELHVEANKAADFLLTNFGVYRAVSTRSILLQTFVIGGAVARSCFYPAVQGGFLGTLFYGTGLSEYRAWGETAAGRAFIVTSAEGSDVRIMDLDGQVEFGSGKAKAGGYLSLFKEARTSHMAIESGRPVMVMFKSGEDDGGISFGGLKANQEAYVFVPEGKAYVFTYRDTTLTLDDMNFRVPADSMIPLPQGLHRMSTSENLIFEIENVGAQTDLASFGATIPSVQSLSISHENLPLKPIGEETPWMYYAAVAILAIGAGVGLWQLKKRH